MKRGILLALLVLLLTTPCFADALDLATIGSSLTGSTIQLNTNAQTARQLSTDTNSVQVILSSLHSTSSALVYVGGSNVATGTGLVVPRVTQSLLYLNINNPSNLYLWADQDNPTVSYCIIKK